ncbi:hypothetical protein BO79DRAFT_258379 [Aspergillus costaricaensis CBS 115574]|uniref:Uncharacterized protein n=1 Tax=Aspergillus costaricaensis CBS 115574 TaxID=1448317 RepID=A0ACD1I587_9EURO|nr:hypothetical protein BO79DRAFT_258379 [Aspergillus costaricaensis CBS 115574]RAK85378.1 hypothetical protein BO79DRAFT_258379 [Aspergillus costaricaensis CBS 115574]
MLRQSWDRHCLRCRGTSISGPYVTDGGVTDGGVTDGGVTDLPGEPSEPVAKPTPTSMAGSESDLSPAPPSPTEPMPSKKRKRPVKAFREGTRKSARHRS